MRMDGGITGREGAQKERERQLRNKEGPRVREFKADRSEYSNCQQKTLRHTERMEATMRKAGESMFST